MFSETDIMHKMKNGSIRYLPFLGHQLTEEEKVKLMEEGKERVQISLLFVFQEILYFYIFFFQKLYVFIH